MRVAIKYCGSCNPHTDVAWIGSTIQSWLRYRKVQVVPVDSTDLDALVLICGCPRACIDRPDIWNRATVSVVVAGETVDRVPISESRIPSRVTHVLEELTNEV